MIRAMTVPRAAIAALFGLAMLPALPMAAQAEGVISIKDPMASDALIVFTKACIITRAVPDKIAAKLVEFEATKLPDPVAVELAHGKAGSQGWKLNSLHGAQLWVSFVPPRQCSVLVKHTQARALQNGTVQVLEQLAQGGEMHFKLEHHNEQPTVGGSEETSEFLLQIIRDQDASVSVTSTDSKAADLQGALTFKVLGVK
jgi:hypothetical protein